VLPLQLEVAPLMRNCGSMEAWMELNFEGMERLKVKFPGSYDSPHLEQGQGWGD